MSNSPISLPDAMYNYTPSAQHTPGPWSLHPYQNGTAPQCVTPSDPSGAPWFNLVRTIGSGDVVIATAEGRSAKLGYPSARIEEVEANAVLIAAAPEMLSALRAAESALNALCSDPRNPALVAVRDAIAAATANRAPAESAA